MAKARKIATKVKVKRRKPSVRTDEDALDLHAAKAAHMYYDPCGSELVPTVYPGDRGYLNRFSVNFNAAQAAGETCTIYAFKPGNNLAAEHSTATSGTNITFVYQDARAPGALFLNGQATKARCAGACVVVRPNASPSNATGMLYFGNLPAQSIVNGGITTLDAIIPQLTHSCSVSQAVMQPLEVKWSPGAFDDRYSPVAGITADDDTDRNILVVVAVGLPAASGINFRSTAIYEYTPVLNGASIDSTSVAPSRCDFSCILRNLKRKDAEWWFSLGKKTLNVAKAGVLGYYTGGPIGATTAMAKFL